MSWLRTVFVAVIVLAGIAVVVLVSAVRHYHHSGPPARERRMRALAIEPLVQSHATRDQVAKALGLEFTDFSVGSTNRQWLGQGLHNTSARLRAERYPGVLFHTTAMTMTWLFFDADGKLQDYYLCEQ